MTHLLCRNRVRDFEAWRAVFDAHRGAHRDSGLLLRHLWRERDDPDNVFFVFEVTDLDAARAFIAAPEAAETGSASGVVDGEYHFVDAVPLDGA